MPELGPEADLASEVEITDLEPRKRGGRSVNGGVYSQRGLFRMRLWLALLTILGVAVFSWLVLSPLSLTHAFPHKQASARLSLTPSPQVSFSSIQVIVEQEVTYYLDQNGIVTARWRWKHKYVYLLWQQQVPSASRLLRVDHNIVYLAVPDGTIIGLRASDGNVLWTKRESDDKR